MLDKRTLTRINDRPRGRRPAAYAALGAAVAALTAALLSYAFAAVVFVAGAGVVFLLYKRDAEASTIKLVYDPGTVEAAPGFAATRAACEALSGAEKVWRLVEGDRGEPPAASSEVLWFDGGAYSRCPVEVGRLETPGISANVDIWGIKTDEVSLFFLPECVLAYRDDLYRAVSYDALGVVYRPLRAAEDGEAPADAEVVGETWRHVRPDGHPDPRRSNNPRYAIASYGLLSMMGAERTGVRLLVSNKAAAMRFARGFGAGQDTSGRDEERLREKDPTLSARADRARRNAEAKVEKYGPLLKVLGVEPGASPDQIAAAYKKKAKMYHPDRVANLDPEVREMAELRMKEVNAAYAELKRKAR